MCEMVVIKSLGNNSTVQDDFDGMGRGLEVDHAQGNI